MANHLNLNSFENYHPEFKAIKEIFYDKNNLEISHFNPNPEYKNSLASSFSINQFFIQHRVAKITPKKIGQFVSIWKRDFSGKTAAYSFDDKLDFLIISIKEKDQMGQFIFPKPVLLENGIIKSNTSKGKLGIRVYPSWNKALNKQAIHSQNWQLKHFYNVNDSAFSGFVKNIFE